MPINLSSRPQTALHMCTHVGPTKYTTDYAMVSIITLAEGIRGLVDARKLAFDKIAIGLSADITSGTLGE